MNAVSKMAAYVNRHASRAASNNSSMSSARSARYVIELIGTSIRLEPIGVTCRSRYARSRGSVKRIVVPCPSWLSAHDPAAVQDHELLGDRKAEARPARVVRLVESGNQPRGASAVSCILLAEL